jgi:hypothetical protein
LYILFECVAIVTELFVKYPLPRAIEAKKQQNEHKCKTKGSQVKQDFALQNHALVRILPYIDCIANCTHKN